MKITDKRGPVQAPELSGKPSEGAPGELQRPEPALTPEVSAAIDAVIKKPDIGEKFWLHDVQFQIVGASGAGLVILPVGVSPRAAKAIRRVTR